MGHAAAPDPADFLDPDEVGKGRGTDAAFKDACESCLAPITWVETAFWCGLGCTFCSDCAADMCHTCPNCQGGLRKRPPQARQVKR